MNNESFTTVWDLMSGAASAMDLLVQGRPMHHEQAAYLAYTIAEEMGLNDNLKRLAMYSSVFHNVDAVCVDPKVEKNGKGGLYEIGTSLFMDVPETRNIGLVVRMMNGNHQAEDLARKRGLSDVAAVVLIAVNASLSINPNKPVLNQVATIVKQVHQVYTGEVSNAVLEAFDRVAEHEFVWMDMLFHPQNLHKSVGNIRGLSIAETMTLTKIMAQLIDYKSSYTAMHSAGVAATAYAIAELLGMSDTECMKMAIAGNLHDLGKLKIDNRILDKPGKLTKDEYNTVREHAYYTYAIMSQIRGFEEITEWASFHHEQLNGNGYPFHLSEKDLCLGARIMAVADVFAAVAEVRPYREGMGRNQALDVLLDDVDRGILSEQIVDVLKKNYETVNGYRDKWCRDAGKKYYDAVHRGVENE